ncbi:MAG: T9SS type A sorting domain-containing protein [Chlorobi bacterium]|nr:T9SS type A sorting domain-containing protein [Chlorobiota bacterium]
MKRVVLTVFGFFALAGLVRTSSAQTIEREILSIVSIEDVAIVDPQTIEFSLTLRRTSNVWERWANGTFQFQIVGVASSRYTPSAMRVELLPNSSDLPIASYANAPLTAYSYCISLHDGWISVFIYGPDEFRDAKYFPLDSTLRLGRFRVTMTDGGRIGSSIAWMEPHDYYQANAYKLEVDSIAYGVRWYRADDNIEMRNYPRIDSTLDRVVVRTDSFRVAPAPEPCLTLEAGSFRAEYLGDRLVQLHWKTLCEQGVRGFVIRRRCLCSTLPPSQTEFTEIRRFGVPFDTALFSKGTTTVGFDYTMSTPDTVNFRDIEYEYELSAIMYDGSRRFLDTTSIRIPISVISSATVYPNPTTTQATIRYTVEDRVRITAKVYDVTGKELALLLDNVVVPRTTSGSVNTIVWNAPDQASQGLYTVVLIARPVDDPTVELSRAILKIQLLR